jgi:FkbM family methyltransferase
VHVAAETFESELGPIQFARGSREEVEFIYREIVGDRCYEQHGVSLEPGAVVLDAGANIGLFALYVDRLLEGACKIFAFEPIPATFHFLEENARQHGLFERGVLVAKNAGLGALDGPKKMTFTHFPALPGNTTLHRREKLAELEQFERASIAAIEGEPATRAFLAEIVGAQFAEARRSIDVECAMTSIAECVREHAIEKIDLLKIDTEGAEVDILSGIDAPAWPRIRQVALETHGMQRAQEIEHMLRAHGFAHVVVEKPEFAVRIGLDNFAIYATRTTR